MQGLIDRLKQSHENEIVSIPVVITDLEGLTWCNYIQTLKNLLVEKKISAVVLSNWSSSFFTTDLTYNLNRLFYFLMSVNINCIQVNLDYIPDQFYIDKLHAYANRSMSHCPIDITISHPSSEQINRQKLLEKSPFLKTKFLRFSAEFNERNIHQSAEAKRLSLSELAANGDDCVAKRTLEFS